MTLFDPERVYRPTDLRILELLGSKNKQAQMRHYNRGPSYYKLGKSVFYSGADLNDWASANFHGGALEK